MKVFTHSEPGGKEVNEDFVLTLRHPQDPSLWICCIADGQGGRANGAAASRTACEVYADNLSRISPEYLFIEQTHANILELVDGLVYKTEGYTTFIGLVADGMNIIGGSSGDSKVYARTADGLMSEFTASQRKNPPVGSGMANYTLFGYTLTPGIRLLMATDGVWKYAGYAQIEKILGSEDFTNAAALLRAETLNRSGSDLPDDFTLVGIQID